MAAQTSGNYETEISLHDVFWYILKNWKILLVCMAVMAVLLGAYKAFSTEKQRAAQSKSADSGSEAPADKSTKTGDPAIVAQPKSVSVEAGKNVSFSVVTTGPVVSYQWQYGKDGMAWTKLTNPSASTETLSFASLATQNGYVYRCVVTFEGEITLNSESAVLTVTAAATAKKLSGADVFKAGVKYAVVGAVLGLVLAAAYFAVVFVMRGYTPNEFAVDSRYHKPTLGIYPSDAINGTERKIMDKLTYRPGLSRDASAQLIAANLNMAAAKSGKVLLMGTVPMKCLADIQAALTPYVNCELQPVGNVNNQADAVNALAEGHDVICVEQVLGSRATYVDFAMGTLSRSASNCLGFILVE